MKWTYSGPEIRLRGRHFQESRPGVLRSQSYLIERGWQDKWHESSTDYRALNIQAELCWKDDEGANETKYQPFVILSSLNCRFRFIVPIILSLVTHESHIFGDFGNWFNQGVSSEEIIVGCCWHHRLSNLVIICRNMKELITQLNATAASFSVDEILILISDSRSRSSNRCWSKNWWY